MVLKQALFLCGSSSLPKYKTGWAFTKNAVLPDTQYQAHGDFWSLKQSLRCTYILNVLAIVLNDLQILIHLIIIRPYKHCYCLCIIDEKTKAQRGWENSSRSHS